MKNETNNCAVFFQETLENISPSRIQGFCDGWKKPLSPEQIFTILERSPFRQLAIDSDSGNVVGFVYALSDGINFAFIPLLEVLPNFQHRGIGSQLMQRILQNILETGIQCIDLSCDEELVPFYQKLGMLPSHGMVIRAYLNQGT